MTIRTCLAAIMATALTISAPTLAQTPAAPREPACVEDSAFKQMDFTLGLWSVYDEKGAERAQVLMESAINGCAILETWSSFDGTKVTGVGLFNYSRILKGWTYAWASQNGSSTLFLGHQVEPDNIRYVTSRPGEDGTTVVRHWSLIALPDGRVRELSVKTSDGGATWATEYDLYWVKKPQS